jgi:hypothetical protein
LSNNFKTKKMKNLNKFGLILFLAVSSILSSCSSDDSDGGSQFSGPSTGTFIKAKAAGSSFLSEGQFATGGYSNGSLVLTGANSSGKSIGIQLYAVSGSLAVGSYNINASQDESIAVGNLQFTDVNLSTFAVTPYSSVNCENASGTLEITFIDATKIEGTFSFIGKEVMENEACTGGTKNITNGSFRLELGS